ncbi:MAG TPA: response regulator transcription factor [Flavipsychrobacter sp.]|nr:response regulator transcription factor [Flavipsychrobacter sp.]
MKTNVLIIDDEPLAQEILESYLLKVPGYEVVAKCKNALEAFSILSKQQVDLMLLDINMPEINGMDFLKTLKNPPLVIFTTAYSEFAVESYELDAIDYLVKPISFERFLKAVHKINDLQQSALKPANLYTTSISNSSDNLMFVKAEGKLIKIDLSQLWFVEGLKDYVRLWTDAGKIIVHSTMKNFEDQLAKFPMFVRVSKSYIINMKYVNEIDGNIIRIKDQMITIGNTYRDEINKLFDSYKLQ